MCIRDRHLRGPRDKAGVTCRPARLRGGGPQRQSNRPQGGRKTIKSGLQPRVPKTMPGQARKQSKRRPKQSKMVQNNPKMVQNDPKWHSQGREAPPGRRRRRRPCHFRLFWTILGLFWTIFDCFRRRFDCFLAWPGIVFRTLGWEPDLIVFRPPWGMFDCLWGPPPL